MGKLGIVVDDVRRSFGEVHAVRGMSFEAEAGRVTGLVGPNGAGKTTLMLMLASLLAPDSGTIRFGDIDPIAEPHRARAVVGWMPDALGAWSSLTARETLTMTGRLYGATKQDAASRAAGLLDRVGLADLADAPARVLSRGQKQRLGLARALVHDPQVLLLDEPASGLDPQARIELRGMLRGFAAEGRTVLLSSHVLSELEEVVDTAVFVEAGTTVAADRVAAAAHTSREWRLRIAGTTADAERERVASVLGIPAGVDRQDILITLAGEQAAVEALRTLVQAGVPVVEFAPATGSLEHAFLDLQQPGPPPASPPSPAPPVDPTAPTEGDAA
ncbi:multidrug ABC transporter ATPase [Microbacterium mangrovi]|uniref:Multidrug ABC transporter ATPase n=1 Tax=Microbacterium mangrovi TaxID=1348253 RepID=A0A0B1ZYS5_9MICO|nr:ABC transporter ATP-binding protein [Microbacterium mangrovi]KHK95896.1 multidrug ABC transporter ATPase [Microbacterium mangrovi]